MDETTYRGIPASEVAAYAELMNMIDMGQRRMFGDSVNAAIITNVKAAHLKGQQVGVRGLARVIGLQPSTIRRRIAGLVEAGWLVQDENGIHYTAAGLERGAPQVRYAMLKMAGTLKRLGWGDFRPPP